MTRRKYRIIFLNQMAGPLFREMAEDLSTVWAPSLLHTGHKDTLKYVSSQYLSISQAPEYDRTNIPRRLISWVKYFFSTFKILWHQPSDSFLLIVSNPPFLGLIGMFFKVLRRQSYVMLVYDVYPDLLVNIGVLKSRHIARMWDSLNRLVYKHSRMVFTIGHDMAQRLQHKQNSIQDRGLKVACIPPWVDVDNIRPIPKHRNQFALKHGLLNKTTVLYSGNMGYTHDIETILEAAKELSDETGIMFVFIGEGAKWHLVEQAIKDNQLRNVLLLPFQPEDVLPFSMASGDIGVVAYAAGTEGCMIPSKTFYYMAGGVVPLILSAAETDLTEMVEEKKCGIWVKSGDAEGLAESIKRLHRDPARLDRLKRAARKTAETDYSRKNTKSFEIMLRSCFPEDLGSCRYHMER